ncbi:MAG: T9SS type A sorting domain-containing protein, partial [Bacteroidota bacterium]
RERQVTVVTRETLIPADSLLPQFQPGENFTATLNYSTGVANGVEEDLNYVAMQLRQVDGDFNIVNTSAFQAVVNGDAANTDEVDIDYTLPTTFADGSTIPLTPELPEGHKLILLIFMSVDSDAGFANANSEISIYALPDRDRMITFVNKADFIPDGSSVPVFNPGETFTAVLNYSTGVTNSVEEQVNYVGMRVRQEDADGALVDRSSLVILIGRDEATVGEEALEFTLPTTFGGGPAIPLTADLPAGHRLVLEVSLSVDFGAGSANDDTEIIISTARERQVTFVNRSSFIAPGDSLPSFSPGQNISAQLAYSTGISPDGTEEDLNYIAMQVRWLAADGSTLNTSAFMPVIGTGAANEATTSVVYTVPTTFPDGSDIPLTEDLMEGEQLLLLLFMSVDNDAAFANDNGPIRLVEGTGNGDRVREIEWTNKDAYRPVPGAPPTFGAGQTFSMGLRYSTANAGDLEEDLFYAAMMVRQVDGDFNIINTSEFQVVVDGDQPNFGNLIFDYTLPTTFADGATIPFSDELPAGHQLLLLVFMSVDEDGGFANDNTPIVYDRSVATDDRLAAHLLEMYPNPTDNDLTLSTSGELRNVQVSILDLLGRQLATRHYDLLPARITVPTHRLASGTYLLQIADGQGQVSRRFVRR